MRQIVSFDRAVAKSYQSPFRMSDWFMAQSLRRCSMGRCGTGEWKLRRKGLEKSPKS